MCERPAGKVRRKKGRRERERRVKETEGCGGEGEGGGGGKEICLSQPGLVPVPVASAPCAVRLMPMIPGAPDPAGTARSRSRRDQTWQYTTLVRRSGLLIRIFTQITLRGSSE
ncbi:Ubiquitin carboxyl-terminal hydrolase puf [Frankliniella fusca]|uniref:Ubiquitin carboxyl-terminal hydrolase puf n=1 Tax=Frankliniella fusca TaxID=407009 RepID=A0AAE1H0L6_9NEOP|nr:Ubiquitin carboxyl-terminal hydrolase puf [Frankliniella fusca]